MKTQNNKSQLIVGHKKNKEIGRTVLVQPGLASIEYMKNIGLISGREYGKYIDFIGKQGRVEHGN